MEFDGGNLLRGDSLQYKRKFTERFTGRCVISDRIVPDRELPIPSINVLPLHFCSTFQSSNLPVFQPSNLPIFHPSTLPPAAAVAVELGDSWSKDYGNWDNSDTIAEILA